MFVTRSSKCHKILSRRNWQAVKGGLLNAIREADFVSMDYELTGLHEKNERYLGIDMAYNAHCQGVKAFLPVQLGICASKFNPQTSEWDLTPASIYLYPWMTGDDDSVCFSVSTAALNFLILNGFDCNEWVTQGLGWLTPLQEEEKRRSIQSRLDEVLSMKTAAAAAASGKSNSSFTPLDIPDGPDKEAMALVKEKIEKWLLEGGASLLELPMESAFTRLLAHTYISHEFPSLFSHSVKRGDLRLLCVYKNREDLFAEQIEGLKGELARVDDQVGVRAIFEEISNSKIPLVGHNCFYDLMHTWHSFFGPIPQDVDGFKFKWMSKFRNTFDTKLISDEILGAAAPGTLRGLCEQHMNSSESSVKMRVKSLSPAFEYHLPGASSADLSHDAGYDAMMTSIVFIHQLAHVTERKSLSDGSPMNKTLLVDIMKANSNRIRLVKTQPPSLHLGEREK